MSFDRNKLILPVVDTVELVIGSRDSGYGQIGSDLQARFVCIHCDNLMIWNDLLFECIDCHAEMTSVEAAGLLSLHLAKMQELMKQVGVKLPLWTRIKRWFTG